MKRQVKYTWLWISLMVPVVCMGQVVPSFTGSWSYSNNVENITSGKELTLKQYRNNTVTGQWSEGVSTGSGGNGKVRGQIRGDKLFLSYCTEGDIAWYKPCPIYEKSKNYFIRKNNKLIEYIYVKNNSGKYSYQVGDVFKLINGDVKK